MGQAAAKQGDQITATDIHLILIPGASVPTLVPHPFAGLISGGLSTNVNVMGMPAATVGSTVNNMPPHIPQGGSFVKPPTNRGQVITGSPKVMVNGKAMARNGDAALTCNDPVDRPAGTVVAVGTVMVG